MTNSVELDALQVVDGWIKDTWSESGTCGEQQGYLNMY